MVYTALLLLKSLKRGEVKKICGIYGSFNPSKFEILDRVNQKRGNFASGLLFHNGEIYDIQRKEGIFDWDDIKLFDGFMYLGHNQAPTSSERKWQEHNSHPFVCEHWAVAHNGVLTNFNELRASYLPNHENSVDSSIIPALLLQYEQDLKIKCKTPEQEIPIIQYVLNLLQGTFGLWIVNLRSLNVYIARQGSTLFADYNSFSSTKGIDYVELQEGVIYSFAKNGAQKVGEFKAKSPFLEL